jgi:hypothetical protein
MQNHKNNIKAVVYKKNKRKFELRKHSHNFRFEKKNIYKFQK